MRKVKKLIIDLFLVLGAFIFCLFIVYLANDEGGRQCLIQYKQECYFWL